MILWKDAEILHASDFGELMLAYIGASMSSTNKQPNYQTLASLIYRSHSRMQKWLSPNSKEPLPITERHHLYLAVLCMHSQRRWSDDEIEYISTTTKQYTDVARDISRSLNAITIKKQDLRSKACIKPTPKINPMDFDDEQKHVLLSDSLTNKQKKVHFKVKSESTIINWIRKLKSHQHPHKCK